MERMELTLEELKALAIVMQVAIVKLSTVKQENSLTSQERIAIIFSDCVVQQVNSILH